MRRLVCVVSISGLLAIGCGGKASPPPVDKQLRDVLQHVVATADASARVDVCNGSPDGGQGRYVCAVQWPDGGGPPTFYVRVDEHGLWRTDELPEVVP
jgi:hypothetical protein